MLEIDNLRNDSQKYLDVMRGDFFRIWVSIRHPDDLLAKTMSSLSLLKCIHCSHQVYLDLTPLDKMNHKHLSTDYSL